jgi:hypothetical protein
MVIFISTDFRNEKTASVQKTEAVFCVRQIYRWSKGSGNA